jgi:formyltetrahydrofolate deformylase
VDDQRFLLTLTCPERAGVVHAVLRFLIGHRVDIIDNRQFGDRRTGRFFMRMHVATDPAASLDALRADFVCANVGRSNSARGERGPAGVVNASETEQRNP